MTHNVELKSTLELINKYYRYCANDEDKGSRESLSILGIAIVHYVHGKGDAVEVVVA